MAVELDIDKIVFDYQGLAPCVVQDWSSGEVLMLAYMNREVLDLTLSSKEMYFWSRSRGEIWHKGATSGSRQILKELRYDCDNDSLLALVDPLGPACHSGERSCFFRSIGERQLAPHEALPILTRTLERRGRELPEGSYTTQLLRGGADAVGAKVREEAEEVARAAGSESDERVCEEAGDLLYHLAVLLQARGLNFSAASRVLLARMDPE